MPENFISIIINMVGRKIIVKSHRRKAYVRKDGTRVKATHVKSHKRADLGLPGHGPKTLPKLKKNELPGYHVKGVKAETRRKKLRKIAKNSAVKTRKVARSLQLHANYTKRSQPGNSRKYNADAKYMMNRYHDMVKK